MQHVVIIGAGMGGLAAAVRLAQGGCRVTVVEARAEPGGLAAHVDIEGFRFDAGPYILLDRPGLEWAFRQLRIDVAQLSLQRVEQVYETDVAGKLLRVSARLDETAAGIEGHWPGVGRRYREFIAQMQARYARLQPLQCLARPGIVDLLRSGAWRDIPYLLRSLGSVMASSRLPAPLVEALGIWTHVAGQTLARAPAPLSLVPGVIHGVGAWYPRAGIGVISETLFQTAQQLGVEFRLRTTVSCIGCHERAARSVSLSTGEVVTADAILSDVGLGTYLHLLDEEGRSALPARAQQMLASLPLQSPGVCAYLAVKGRVDAPYLRFRIQNEPDGCRLLVTPSVLNPALTHEGWSPARLIAPLNHQRAQAAGEAGQRAFLAEVLKEDWWQRNFQEFRVLATRIPREWGGGYHLFQDSMNPVMTAEFMRAGRLAHRSPWIRNLYLTGSATHPGQWVSFCAVAGVLTADRVLQDRQRHA